MIKSAISTGHHYYLVLFKPTKTITLNKIVKMVGDLSEKIRLKETNVEVFHLQKSINYLFGSSSLLEKNKDKKVRNGFSYWYDFYIGKMDIKGEIYYLAFPYKSLQSLLFKEYPSVFTKAEFFTPVVKTVLDAMRHRTKTADKELLVEIIKYSAEIEDEVNADKVHIVGQNPQYSAVYDLLNNSKNISVKPSSLRLRFWNENIGEIILAFDRLGNYRIWIFKDKINETVAMLPLVFTFFFKIEAVETKSIISAYTTLETD